MSLAIRCCFCTDSASTAASDQARESANAPKGARCTSLEVGTRRENARSEVGMRFGINCGREVSSSSASPVSRRVMPFSVARAAQPKKGTKRRFPRAADILLSAERQYVAAPPVVAAKLRGEVLLIGVDIETHDWSAGHSTNLRGSIGQFGHYNLCMPCDIEEPRIVQIGWAVRGSGDRNTVVTERLVRPDGFRVSEKATAFHRITHACAAEEGVPLPHALAELMRDALEVSGQGGRLVCHHLEFDAGIIARELSRCKMADASKLWADIARAGICTMDPHIGSWVRQSYNDDREREKMISLKELVRLLVPERKDLLGKHHTAAADACMVLEVAFALHEFTLPPPDARVQEQGMAATE